MNEHLKLVREFHNSLSFPQADHGTNVQLSDMDVVMRQALLMEKGSEILKAIKAGDMVEILGGLVGLAYYALGAIATQGADVIDHPISWQHAGSVLPLMRLVSDKINTCSTGSPDNYSEVYCLCVHLARSFLNADFDKAFQKVHDSYVSNLHESGKSIYDDAGEIRKSSAITAPDLSDCLYE